MRSQVPPQGGYLVPGVYQDIRPARNPVKDPRADAPPRRRGGIRGRKHTRSYLAKEGRAHSRKVVSSGSFSASSSLVMSPSFLPSLRPSSVLELTVTLTSFPTVANTSPFSLSTASLFSSSTSMVPTSRVSESFTSVRRLRFLLASPRLLADHPTFLASPFLDPELLPHVKIDRGAIRFLLAVRPTLPPPSRRIRTALKLMLTPFRTVRSSREPT